MTLNVNSHWEKKYCEKQNDKTTVLGKTKVNGKKET